MKNILEVKNLCKQYPEFKLEDVSFSLPHGYIMGFIGPNGAGKTTTMKAILGMILPDKGAISLFGKDCLPDSISGKEEIGVVMDLPFYVEDWKAEEVEAAVSPFYTRWNRKAFTDYLKRFGISRKKKVKELSRGMKVKLMLAVALSHGAKLLILDEPTSGLDPVAREELMELLGEFIADESRSILFSTHITSDLEKIADFITIIQSGKIVFTGEKDVLMESYFLVKGGRAALSQTQRKKVIGYRENEFGFSGMLRAQDCRNMPQSVSLENITLDEIVVFMNKEARYA